MRAFASVFGFLAACAYQPGSFHSVTRPFSGQQATIDCLDLSVERRVDRQTEAVLGFSFGNRCDHPVLVDLASVAVVGRTREGRELQLIAYDPLHEVRAIWLDGRAVGSEALAYPTDAPLGEICVDAASIIHAPASHWLCLASHSQPPEVP
jgi:hypothetical protein